ncbi:MAG: hypothetical protein JW881_21975 [Spirochaetales bacterium]|nr:hypothetical protein [Spirochaetales bacterium]
MPDTKIKTMITQHIRKIPNGRYSIVSLKWEPDRLVLCVKDDNKIFDIIQELWSSWRNELDNVRIMINDKKGNNVMQATFGKQKK